MKRSSARRCPASMRFCSTSECLRCRSTRRLEASPSRRTALLICGWIRVNKPLPQQRSSTPTPQQISLGSSVPTRTRSGPAVSRISRCARARTLPSRRASSWFAKFANRCTCPPDLPACMCGKQPILDIVTRKPVLPTAEEIERNARARSAKLRVAQKR